MTALKRLNYTITDADISRAWRRAMVPQLLLGDGLAPEVDFDLPSPAFAAGFRAGVYATPCERGATAFCRAEDAGGRAEYRRGHGQGVAWRTARDRAQPARAAVVTL